MRREKMRPLCQRLGSVRRGLVAGYSAGGLNKKEPPVRRPELTV
jgi:hypothetical protein